MAKFYGQIGFVKTVMTDVEIWDTVEYARIYPGDLIRSQRRWSNGESVNENLDVSNEISIVLDDFMQKNLGSIKWAEVMGSKWKVNSIIMEYPRIRLTLGGVYNGG